VKTNEHLMTTMPGLFAAGDVRSGAWRQIITAVADGALSVKYIEEYLNK
jgi:thioredoxin reductase (NADPH)